MRIISGKYRGRQLHPPRNLPVRPTTDYAKESLFNVLFNLVDIEGMKVLDLFAGTGSISFEFLSRGAGEVVAVERDFRCTRFIRNTAALLGDPGIKAVRANVFSYLETAASGFDLVFADPPYDMERTRDLPGLVLRDRHIKSGGWFILEHNRDQNFGTHPFFSQHRTYGAVNFTFFQYSSS